MPKDNATTELAVATQRVETLEQKSHEMLTQLRSAATIAPPDPAPNAAPDKPELPTSSEMMQRTLEAIEIPDLLTVQELATSMIVPVKDIITELIKMGTMETINQNIPSDVAISVAKKFGFNAVIKEAGDEVTVEQE